MNGRKAQPIVATVVALAILVVATGATMTLAVHVNELDQALPPLESDTMVGSPVSGQRLAQDEPTSWIPFDPAPAITLPTRSGVLTIVQEPGQPLDQSFVFVANEPRSGVSAQLWGGDPAWILELSPLDVNYVFMSYGATEDEVQGDIDDIRRKVNAAINELQGADQREHWRAHMHYVTVNPLTLGTPVSALLRDWGAAFAEVDVEWMDGDEARGLTASATTDGGWAKSLVETGPMSGPVGLYGNLACEETVPTSPVTDTIALIQRGECAFSEKLGNAEKHGATASIIFTTPDRELITMGSTCEDCPEIPIVMIGSEPGETISDTVGAGHLVTATLRPAKGGAEMFAVDRRGRLNAFGSIPWPWNEGNDPVDPLRAIAYEAQYLTFEHERDEVLVADEASGDVTVVPVITDTWVSDPGWAGAREHVAVELPNAEEMATYDTLELWLSLGCEDHWRSNCPAWDYITNMYLCAEGETDRCSLEFGRWITPYWSEGRWIVDVSPLLGLISDGGTRHFEFYTQQRYKVDLSIRLSNRGKGHVQKQAVRLDLNGGQFWDDYNGKFDPIDFQVPEWAGKVEVMSVISGHGFGTDTENCAEFCNHTHHYTVTNGSGVGTAYELGHPIAGSLMGCAEQVVDGTVPNQGGTWIYGRGGWCPGLEVTPWVVDITDAVQHGVTNTLHYRGLFDGADFDPVKLPDQTDGFNARIDMRAFMVFSENVDIAAPGIYLPLVMRGFDQ